MAKFNVNVYYEYCATIEVDADNAQDAEKKGIEIADNLPTSSLTYISRTDAEVEEI
jgi:hypothetical protein